MCPASHRRWFESSRLRSARRRRGLTRAAAAEQIREYGDGGCSERIDLFDEAALAAIESGAVELSFPTALAAAAVYRVPLRRFTVCTACAVARADAAQPGGAL